MDVGFGEPAVRRGRPKARNWVRSKREGRSALGDWLRSVHGDFCLKLAWPGRNPRPPVSRPIRTNWLRSGASTLPRQIGFGLGRCADARRHVVLPFYGLGCAGHQPHHRKNGWSRSGKTSPAILRNRGSRPEGSDARSSPGAAGGFSHQCPCRYAPAAGATSATRRAAAASGERKMERGGRQNPVHGLDSGKGCGGNRRGLGDRGNIASRPDGMGTDGKGIFLPILRAALAKDRGMSLVLPLWAPGVRGHAGLIVKKCIRMGSGRTIPGGSSFCDYPGITTYEFQSCRVQRRLGRGYRDRLSPGLQYLIRVLGTGRDW